MLHGELATHTVTHTITRKISHKSLTHTHLHAPRSMVRYCHLRAIKPTKYEKIDNRTLITRILPLPGISWLCLTIYIDYVNSI